MRNISFSLTTAQVYAQTKTVTRRFGWWFLKPGDRLMACEKCQGLGKGGKMVRIGPIEIVSVRREKPDRMIMDAGYGRREVILEGFPHLSPLEFVMLLCVHNNKKPTDYVNRIEFKYLPNLTPEGGK